VIPRVPVEFAWGPADHIPASRGSLGDAPRRLEGRCLEHRK